MSNLSVAPQSLDWALTHIEQAGDTDIFPVPFEFLAIRHDWLDRLDAKGKKEEGLRTWLARQDLMTWQYGEARSCLTPVGRFGFRVSSQLDPLDSILLTALVYEAGKQIEAARLPASKKIVHSYRFAGSPDGRFYDDAWSYASFTEESRKRCSKASCKYVVIADIADFFPRLYSHPLENALTEALKGTTYTAGLRKWLEQLNQRVSYGIPVGPDACRLLSEIAITDVDFFLASEKVDFVRYSDDYRIFCNSESDAYSALTLLANTLFRSHGLTLQKQKTKILPKQAFQNTFLDSEERKERRSLSKSFSELLSELDIHDTYGRIEYEFLSKTHKKKIDMLNLVAIINREAESDMIDIPLCRFVLRRLQQVDDAQGLAGVLHNLSNFYPVLKEAIQYIERSVELGAMPAAEAARKFIDVLEDPRIGSLEFCRAWVLELFSRHSKWNHKDEIPKVLGKYTDQFTRRAAILAMGRSGQSFWFRPKKADYRSLSAWERRAFIAAASCLPGDESKHWYQSISSSCNRLEQAVIWWVRKFPFK